MRIKHYYNGERISDYLDSKVSEENYKLVSDIANDKLNDYIYNLDFLISKEYIVIIDAVTRRELLKPAYSNMSTSKIELLLSVKNIENIITTEFIEPSRIKTVYDKLNDLSVSRLTKLIEEGYNELEERYNFLKSREFESEDEVENATMLFYTICVYERICAILIYSIMANKVIQRYNKWKFSPERFEKYKTLYDELILPLQNQKRFTTKDPNKFYQYLFEHEDFKNIQFPDPIPDPDLDAFIHVHHVMDKKTKEIDEVYELIKEEEKQKTNYIIDKHIIIELFRTYGKYMGESENSWCERFINIENAPFLTRPSNVEKKYATGNNLHILYTILSLIDNKILDQNHEVKKVSNFEVYVNRRWGITNFRDNKSRYFQKNKYSEWKIIDKMIQKEY